MKSEENMQVIARTQGDDSRDTDLRAEDILPNEMAATINYDNMMILIGMCLCVNYILIFNFQKKKIFFFLFIIIIFLLIYYYYYYF